MKSTRIILKKKSKKNGKLTIDQADITDGISITKYSDTSEAQKSYLGLKQRGVCVSLHKGVIIQRYKDKKKAEIVKLHIAQIEALKKTFEKKLDISYTTEEIEYG